MKEIKLNLGKFALIDEEDFELVSRNKWYVSSNGYVVGNFRHNKKNKTVLLSRYLMNPPKGFTVDHINRNKLDNQRKNLRIVTQSINCHNQKVKKSNKTGYVGVYFHKEHKKWEAKIRMNYKRVYLGSYNSAEEAEKVYLRAKRIYCE